MNAESWRPSADPRAVVVSGNARFTILTPALVRMEWSKSKKFEDRASFAVVNRRLPVPAFKAVRAAGWLTVQTSELTLRYKEKGGAFSKENLSIEFNLNGRTKRWVPGSRDTGNLGGTVRTLDAVSGATELDRGILSRNGWVLVDDSENLLFDGRSRWATPRERQSIDWYFFGYGHDYKRALRDYTSVAGRVPLPPKYVFGMWWSRYWDYSDQEFKHLVQEFRDHGVPLDVLVIDMDWHLDGWTGYTWNPKYFPEPQKFLDWAHNEGLRITLNLHPADGVKKHEARFAEMARAMRLDPKTTEQIPFDCADPKFVKAYFAALHHPLEKEGVDFWWIDWQQGEKTKIEGLDPLWWLNHLHWSDMETRERKTGRRPLILSRWGGLGNHRYQIGFSGDVYSNWKSLAFQPYFTATAGNVAYPYWSHDIGGHHPGPVEPELFARWVQWGAFSPILRTHGTKSEKAERRIWKFPTDVFESARGAICLRHQLTPYIYTAARQSYDEGIPLCRPLYYEWPEFEEAYTRTDEYLFGDQLLVAPIANPVSPSSRVAESTVWIPPGEWTHWFTGKSYAGPAEVILQTPLDEIPLFVRSGGIIPAMRLTKNISEKSSDTLVIHIFPGDSGEARIYEDDNKSAEYQNGKCAWTPVSHRMEKGVQRITIGPAEGSYRGMPATRQFEIRLRDLWPPRSAAMNGRTVEWHYDTATLSTVICLPGLPVRDRINVEIIPSFDDESILRGGFRGQLAVAVAVSEILGDDTLKNMAMNCRRDILRDPHMAPAAAREFQEKIRIFLGDIGRLNAPEPARTAALLRLLGLSCDIRVQAAGPGNKILATVAASLCRETLPRLDRLTADVRFVPGSHWKSKASPNRKMEPLSIASPVRLASELVPKNIPQTDILRAIVNIQWADGGVEIPLDAAVLPSINAWWITGPFDAPFEKAFDMEFPPEGPFRPKARFTGKSDKRFGWKQVTRSIEAEDDLSDEFYIDFHKLFGARYSNAVAYAYTCLYSPAAKLATLALGSDDGVEVWLNGKEIFRNAVGRPYVSKQDRIPLHLKKGKNELLLKINQGGGEWGFAAHVETEDGRPIPGIEVK